MKVEASQLRIGNLIQLDPEKDWFPGKDIDKPIVVRSISEYGINYSMDYSDIYWDEFDRFAGIELNEEWLKRMGFEYEDSHTCLYFDKLHSISETRPELDYWVFMPFCTNDEDCYIKVKYVHTLQNLIFYLTGHELEIK